MGYSNRFEEALVYAHRLHHRQVRRGSRTPYINHLLSVAALVGEHGGSEDQVIAALLHDAIEDQGGPAIAAEIRHRFGEAVAELVEACSDTDEDPKPPWRPRKEAYLQHLRSTPPEVLLITAADKLHNVRSMIIDLRSAGDALWGRFSGGREGTLWYYRSVLTVLEEIWQHPLLEELAYRVNELERMTASPPTSTGT